MSSVSHDEANVGDDVSSVSHDEANVGNDVSRVSHDDATFPFAWKTVPFLFSNALKIKHIYQFN